MDWEPRDHILFPFHLTDRAGIEVVRGLLDTYFRLYPALTDAVAAKLDEVEQALDAGQVVPDELLPRPEMSLTEMGGVFAYAYMGLSIYRGQHPDEPDDSLSENFLSAILDAVFCVEVVPTTFETVAG